MYIQSIQSEVAYSQIDPKSMLDKFFSTLNYIYIFQLFSVSFES